jgi:ribosome biogenesis GTPase
MPPMDDPRRARVHETYPHYCDIELLDDPGGDLPRAAFAPSLEPGDETLITTGDLIDVVPLTDDLDASTYPRHAAKAADWVVVRIHPRESKLSRPGKGRHGGEHFEQVMVANVDLLAIVVSVRNPPYHPRLIDRFLVSAERGEVPPLLCLNKIDLLDDDAPPELADIDQFGIDVLRYSAATGEGLDALHDAIRGRTVAFVGHSGTGKSSTMNAMFPELALRVGRLRRGDQRGRHTTTRVSLFRVDDEGTLLVDTPGIKSLDIWGIEPDELRWYFPEFEDHWNDCRFNDCTHTHEVGCAVKEAVEAGTIRPLRYDAYVRLYEAMRTGRS